MTLNYHLSLPPLMKVVIGSTPTILLTSSFVLLSFNGIPHIHLVSASLLFQTSTRHQGPSLTSISHAASDTTGIHSTFHLQRGSSGCQKWQQLSELHPSISDSSCSSKIRSTISIKRYLLLCLIKLFSISEHLHFIQNSLAFCMDLLMVLYLRYSEVECHSFICFFSLRRSSHIASIALVIHGFFLLWHSSVAVSLIAVLKVLVNASISTYASVRSIS